MKVYSITTCIFLLLDAMDILREMSESISPPRPRPSPPSDQSGKTILVLSKFGYKKKHEIFT